VFESEAEISVKWVQSQHQQAKNIAVINDENRPFLSDG
jgi:hypothetical protein